MNSFQTLLLYNPSMAPVLRRRQPYYCPVASVGQQYVRMLFLYIQLTRKADMTDAVSPINLPRSLEKVKPGMMCSVAGWGQLGVNMPSADKLQEVDLEVHSEEKGIARFKNYIPITQICAGDSTKRKNSFSVRSSVLSMQNPGPS